MKKLFVLLTIIGWGLASYLYFILQETEAKAEEDPFLEFANQRIDGPAEAFDYGYEAIYSSSWKIGNPENSKMILDLQKAAVANDFEKAISFIHPDIVINNADGTSIKGIDNFKEAFESYLKAFKFKITPAGWISVDTSDGDEWVVLWADEEITAPDGSIDSHYAHEGFKIKDGKIITVNQYYRPKLK